MVAIKKTNAPQRAGSKPWKARFQAITSSLNELDMIHGTNEHLTLDNLKQITTFYARLIATAAN